MPRGVLFWFLPFVFLFSFSIYLTHLGPTYQPDDSAETVAACVTLAPQHPSGYPLYTIAGHLFSWIPIGNPAFRLNLLAAGLGAFLVTLVGWTLFWMGSLSKPGKRGTSLVLDLFPAFGGAMVLALSKTYWTQCLTAKGVVYILQGLVFLGLIGWLEKRETSSGRSLRSYLAVGLLSGLGFANGWEMQTLFLIAVFLFLFSRGSLENLRSLVGLKKVLFCGSFTFLGASPLLLMPLRQWGPTKSLVWGDPRHFSGFVGFLSNRDVRQEVGLKIWGNILHLSARKGDWADAFHQLSSLGPQLDKISGHLSFDLGLLAWIPLIAGVLFLKRMKKYPLLVLGLVTCLLLIVANGFVFLTPQENLWCVDKFFTSVNIFGALCVGIGLREWGTRMGTYSSFKGLRNRPAFQMVMFVLCLSFPAFSFLHHSKPNDQSSQTFAYDYGADLLKSLKKGAVFVGEGDDNLFSVYFFQEVLGLRKDVTLVPAYYLWSPWGAVELEGKLPGLGWDPVHWARLTPDARIYDGMTRLLDQRTPKRPVHVSANLDLLDRCYFSLLGPVHNLGNLDPVLTPQGFAFWCGVGFAGQGFPVLDGPRERSGNDPEPGGPIDTLFNLKAQAYFNAAEYWSRNSCPEMAQVYYAAATAKARAPRLAARIWLGRGATLLKQGKYRQAYEAVRSSIELSPQEAPGWKYLAACEEALGDGQKARLDLQRAMELEKNKKGEAL